MDKAVLYSQEDADALTASEKAEDWRDLADQMKADLILEHLPQISSLLDIGCAWGQVLRKLVGHVPRLAGVDESADRIKTLLDNDLGIEVYKSHSSLLPVDNSSFDAVLTSHIVHEIKLFGSSQDFSLMLKEIKRVLTPSGKYILIDHRDPGDGTVSIRLTDSNRQKLLYFAEKFKYRKVVADISGDVATLSTRDCHDFVTKIWSLGSGAEDLEMNETHTVMKKDEITHDLSVNNFVLINWIPFNNIQPLMDHYGIELVSGDAWDRQFMCLSQPK